MLKCKLNTSQASLTSWAFSLHWCEEKTTYIWGLEKLVHHSQDVAGGGGGGGGQGEHMWCGEGVVPLGLQSIWGVGVGNC